MAVVVEDYVHRYFYLALVFVGVLIARQMFKELFDYDNNVVWMILVGCMLLFAHRHHQDSVIKLTEYKSSARNLASIGKGKVVTGSRQMETHRNRKDIVQSREYDLGEPMKAEDGSVFYEIDCTRNRKPSTCRGAALAGSRERKDMTTFLRARPAAAKKDRFSAASAGDGTATGAADNVPQQRTRVYQGRTKKSRRVNGNSIDKKTS